MKNKTKYLVAILLMLVSFLLIGATNVNAETTDITEIKLTGDYQYGNVPAGILPSFNPGTTTDSITINKMNSGWEYKMESGGWSGFGLETPVAYNDGKTNYGYDFCVKTNDGYQLDYSNLKVFYNDVEVTSSVRVLKYAWGAYVTVDLGKATGENPTTHTVTFNSNGGSEIAPKEVVSGLKIKAPETPTKDKYLFIGWYEDDTFSVPFDFNNSPITSDMTLYAKWEAANSINEIRLVGDIQSGTVSVGTLPSFNPRTTTDSITIDRTNSAWAYKMQNGLWSRFGLETPTAVNDGKTNYGYDFSVKPNYGYQLASDLKVIYNDVDVTSTVKVQTYAWGAYVTVDLGKANGTPVVYTITFNTNDGTPVAPQNVNAGEKLTKPTPAPTKDGFTFDGWYEDSTFSKEFDFNTPITDSMTLYAKWTENKYTLTFDANGGSGTMTPKADLTGEYTLPENGFTAPSGKQFKGWSLTTDGAIVTKVDMTENKTVYAIWEDIPVTTYTLTFDANGGTGSMTAKTGLTGEYTLPENEFTAPSGKQFKGWSLTATGETVSKVDMTENKTVYAIWENIIYTVTFNSNDGTLVESQNVNAGEKLTEPTPAPTKVGFTFDGWYETATFDKKFDFNTPITNNMTLYAKWTENKYTLTFDANGGSGTMAPIADLTGEYDLPANEFTAPSGKKFKGWSLTTDGATVSKVDMTENRTVYAIWEDIPVVTYTLTFNANGGTGSMTAKTGLTGEYTLPANGFTAPTGKKFKGWSLTTDGAIVTKVDMTENKTVYAIWENIPVTTYTLTFDANGGTGSMTAKTGLTGEYTLPVNGFTAPTGKKFKGWSLTTDGAIVTKVDMTENKTVYAIWENIPVTTYTLTFDANGGSGTMAPKADLTGEYTLPANGFTAPSGKQFKGWSLTTDGAIVTKVDMTENKTVYAIWENIPVTTYTLTFDANGGSGTMAPKADLTGEYTLPANGFTAPSGKQFKGWSLTTDGAIITKVDMTENRTVYAIWENIPVVTYTLTFDANGGSGTMAPKADLTGEYTLPANGFTAPTGKQFKGWSLTTDGAIVTKVDMTENRTVYAIWEDIPVVTYTLTFDANGGSGTMAPKADLTGEYTLPANGFTAPTGKQFKGWSLTTDGAIVTKVDMTENKTVYAIWEEIPVTTYTLTFDANGGSGTMAPKADLTGEYTLPANKFTAPSGKKFKGWSLTTDGAIVTKVDMTENKTVYAIWGNITYSYEFLESTGEQTIDGKANSFKIIIDADETKFVSLKVDGVLYEKDVDYTVKHGSTIIEFTSTGLAKLNALSKGEHNVTVTFTDEVINGKINVTTVNPPIIPQNPDVDNPQNPDVDNPQTYDGIFTHISMFVVSILGLVTTVIIGRKRTRTN